MHTLTEAYQRFTVSHQMSASFYHARELKHAGNHSNNAQNLALQVLLEYTLVRLNLHPIVALRELGSLVVLLLLLLLVLGRSVLVLIWGLV
jgi:hypothetical protein